LEIFAILGAAFPPPGTDWREILHGQADLYAPLPCQISRESVQRVATADFRPVSNIKYQLTPLRGVLPVIISTLN